MRRDSLSARLLSLAVVACALLSARASAAPVDIFLEPETGTLYLRVDPGISVGFLSLVVDGATAFTPAPTANISIAESWLDPTVGFVIIGSPLGEPLVPSSNAIGVAVGQLHFVVPPAQCTGGPVSLCGGIREDIDLLGPAVLDLAGTPIPSAIVVVDTPEPATLASIGLVLFALIAARVSRLAAARTAAAARPPRWPRAA